MTTSKNIAERKRIMSEGEKKHKVVNITEFSTKLFLQTHYVYNNKKQNNDKNY